MGTFETKQRQLQREMLMGRDSNDVTSSSEKKLGNTNKKKLHKIFLGSNKSL